MIYEVFAVGPGMRVHRRRYATAPTATQMTGWAKGKNSEAAYVGRYFPKYDAWILLDIRKAFQLPVRNGKSYWSGICRCKRRFETGEAMIATAGHMLMAQVELELER